LRALGKLRPAVFAALIRAPGKSCRTRQILPRAVGKYFHFSEKFRAESPANPRKTWFAPVQRLVNKYEPARTESVPTCDRAQNA
jgi:hypothetical protein